MAYFFGAGMATDAFVTAFRIPNLLRDMFAEGALSSAFVPVFKKTLVNDSRAEALRLASVVLGAILVIVGLIVLVGILAAPLVVYITANGFTEVPGKFDMTVSLTRVMMVYLLMVSVSALLMGMLNSFGRFAIPALSPAMFNLGVVLSVIALYQFFDQPVYTLAIGVLIGGIGQVVIQMPALIKIGFKFKPVISLLDDGLKQVIRLITPMILGLSASRINILVSTLLASFLIEGAISYLNYSYRLMHFPMGVFAVAIGTVALPRVSELVARNDQSGLEKEFTQTINLNLLVTLPSAAFLAILGRNIVDVIYQWGAFTEVDATNTTLALLHYSYGLVGFAVVRVVAPFYYAYHDSKTPMKISVIAVALNLLLYYPLIKMLGFAGLAAATSIAGIANASMLVAFLSRKGIPVPIGRLALNWVRIAIAATLACYLAKMVPYHLSFLHGELPVRIMGILVPFFAAVLLYFVFCLILRVEETTILIRKITRG
jgi:putative peptidoglycan lipid II flippase